MFRTIMTSIALLASVPASATPNEAITQTRHVGYSDINLSTAAGRAKLDRRLRLAAHQVCQDPYDRELLPYTDPDCVKKTLQSARVQMASVVDHVNQPTQIASADR
ncbi:MAG TPA: UrcA family protein [Sphingomonas sp.]|uniref:UrcA family protein n=1 Tax=Sphingomonas sp. TaxID=28214 RepID=UPI002B7BDDFF|nr:UrcA family protein [Sphingomonas sp.]HMI19712.1 UrcA family protein [Sphingomonas sp.]